MKLTLTIAGGFVVTVWIIQFFVNRWARRRGAKIIAKHYADRRIELQDPLATAHGSETRQSNHLIVGNGLLLLANDALIFHPYTRGEPYEFPRTSFRGVGTSTRHLAKISVRPLLRVEFGSPNRFSGVVAWDVRERDRWLKALARKPDHPLDFYAEQVPDHPRPFGYKCTWWALPTEDTERVAEVIGLNDGRPCSWRAGIDLAYEFGPVFVSPPVEGWTFVVSNDLKTDHNDKMRAIALHLAGVFGQAFLFGTHRVVDWHLCLAAEKDRVVRAFAYLGEGDELLWDEGEVTPEERELGVSFRAASDEFDDMDDQEQREAVASLPDEETVMKLAAAWSIDPQCERPNAEPGLGLLGTAAPGVAQG